MKSFTIFSIVASIMGSAAAVALPEAIPDALTADQKAYAASVTVEKVDLSPARWAELNSFNQSLVARQGSCFWQAFTGNTCNQPSGALTDVPAGGRCNDARGRHSFFISSGCPTLRVSINENTDCGGGNVVETVEGPGCYNVNTGRNWQSSFVIRN